MPTFRNLMLKKMSFFKRTDDDNILHPHFRRKIEPDHIPLIRRKTGGHHSRGSMAAHVKSPVMYARRVTVKARFVRCNNGTGDSFRLHLKYIEREGVEKDGSKGVLYSQDDDFNRAHFAREIKGEPHSFRLIISPEDANEIDLTRFTKDLMKQVEKDLGRGLEWTAANHYNTDNPHAHIIIRGIDKKGNELRINREYISHGMRNRASEIITRELGLRTDLEIRNQISKEITAERFTGIDSQIIRHVEDSILDLGAYPINAHERNRQSRIIARLNKLEALGLASRQNPRQWKLVEGWKSHLKQLSERNDIIKTMNRTTGGNPGRYFIVNDKTETECIEGKIHKGLKDELYDKYYAIVETVKGDSYYLRIDRNTMESLIDESIVSVSIERDSRLKKEDLPQRDISNQSNRYSFKSINKLSLRDQIKYRGQVWLDQYLDNPDNPCLAKYGFGAEVSKAARLRNLFLAQELGIGISGDMTTRLDRMEYDEVVKNQKGIHKETLHKVDKIERIDLPNGKAYANMQDLENREFKLVPWEMEHGRLQRELTPSMRNQLELFRKHPGR